MRSAIIKKARQEEECSLAKFFSEFLPESASFLKIYK